MSKSLALLSGKGGSGKTTLALSIASMLSSCEINVLLVDCDMSTNGATYFYENKLNENNGNLISFNEILNEEVNNYHFITINKYFDFLPSILKISDSESIIYAYNGNTEKYIKKFNSFIDSQYDVIIYDCQAGYTELLKTILPCIDTNLVVMEADAISSASIRSLYLKIGNIINDKKVYQIFNKATQEEYDIYSKISGGTVFTNIETVVFDWKIRKAFSLAQVPDMKNTSANYGLQIFNVCNVLFPEKIIQKKLSQFKIIIEINRITEDKNTINKKLEDMRCNRANLKNDRMKNIYSLLSLYLGVFCCLMFFMIDSNFLNEKSIITLSILMSIMMIFLISLLMVKNTKGNKEEQKKYYEYTRKANDLNHEIIKLKHKLANTKKESEI